MVSDQHRARPLEAAARLPFASTMRQFEAFRILPRHGARRRIPPDGTGQVGVVNIPSLSPRLQMKFRNE